MPNDKKLSISIVNFQSENFIGECLASIFKHLPAENLEIIIVNNDEKENLEEIKKIFPEVKIIDHKKNVGFGAGHNLGAEKAEGDLLLFLNPDAELAGDIKPIIDLFKNEKIGAAGPRLLDGHGQIQKWSAGVETSLWDILKNNLGIPESRKIWNSKKTREVGWVSGAALFVRRDLFEKISGFDEKFFMYYEDEDLCQRIREAGKKVIYFPQVEMKHWGSKSVGGKKTQKKYFFESQEYYFQKHLGKWQALALKILRKAVLGI